MICELEHKIFAIEDTGFKDLALAVFQFQYEQNPVYQQYVNLLGVNPDSISTLTEIPFLPIELYKTQQIATTLFEPQLVFESSGTTQTIQSRHFIKDLSIYEQSFIKGFERLYGPVQDWCILGLLPAYLERKHSSLIMMVDELIKRSQHAQSDFYLYEHEKLSDVLLKSERQKQKTLLIGVTFALLDFAEKYPQPLTHTIVMETGGMKGRRKEITRHEVHAILKDAWHLDSVHAEYGMTELLSQAYSKQQGIFECPSWMQVLVRDEDEPCNVQNTGRGLINVIDLANIYSCSFIAADDIAQVHADGRFEVLGRRDNSDLRGCSLMAANI